jgi:DNA-binding MarR family transcriptional regulator
MNEDERGRDEGPGLITLVMLVSKAFYRRGFEEQLGMKLKEFQVLGYLSEHPGTTQQELGEVMLHDPNMVVLLLNELETRGYSIRRRDTEDRRRHVVEITPAGREALDRAGSALTRIEDNVFGELNAEERQSLRRLLEKVLEGLATPAAR